MPYTVWLVVLCLVAMCGREATWCILGVLVLLVRGWCLDADSQGLAVGLMVWLVLVLCWVASLGTCQGTRSGTSLGTLPSLASGSSLRGTSPLGPSGQV